MDQQSSTSNLFNNIEIEAQAKSIFTPIIKWGKITAILGLTNLVLMLVASFTKASGASGLGVLGAYMSMSLMIMVPFVAVAVLINIFLLLFANNAKQGIDTMSQPHFNRAISNLRYYFKTIGIVIIVAIGLVILFLFAALIGVAMR